MCNNDDAESGPVDYYESADQGSATTALLERAEQVLFDIPGVTSVGLGRDASGTDSLIVGVTDAGVLESLPSDIDGMAVVGSVTGDVTAYPED